MSNEELIFRILEEERERRIRKVVETRKIESEDAVIIAVLGLNEEIGEIRSEIGMLRSRIDELSEKMATKDGIRNMATKDDIRNMATKDDIRNMATKDDIRTTQWVTVICFAVLAVIVAFLSLGL